jgi:hypothetical protein
MRDSRLYDPPMNVRLAGAALVLALALLAPLSASGGTPAVNANTAATLKPLIKAKFKKVAPKLVLEKVTCNALADGVTALCKAYFSDPSAGANIVYTIKATLSDLHSSLSWTTTGHSCTDAKTGKKLSC